MARGVKVKLNHAGMRDLLTSTGVESDLVNRAERVAATARQSAPVDSGEYKDAIEVVSEIHGDRVVAQVIANVPHATRVEANTGNLGRALDSAAG